VYWQAFLLIIALFWAFFSNKIIYINNKVSATHVLVIGGLHLTSCTVAILHGWEFTKQFSLVFIVYSSSMATTSIVVWFPKELLQPKNKDHSLQRMSNRHRSSITITFFSTVISFSCTFRRHHNDCFIRNVIFNVPVTNWP